MPKRFVSAILLAVLIGDLLIGALYIGQVRAAGTFYIRADGSIDPPTPLIFTTDYITYTLSGNITVDSANGIVIQRNNAVLDGLGFTITGKNLTNSNGIVLDRTNKVTIENVSIGSFTNGIYGNASTSGHITETSLMNNYYGIYMISSNYNVIDGNNISLNTWGGIWLENSQYNNITGNKLAQTIANNFGGIRLRDFSDNNNIVDNCLTANNRYGVYIENSWSNHIYHNNFTNNFYQAYVDPLTSQTNTWDNGYPSGGNYWNDYSSTDHYSGRFQNETGSDGIADSPYVIDSNNRDNYPLMRPWIPYENGTIYVHADGSVDPTGAPVERKGDTYTLTGNVTTSDSGIILERDNMTLDGAGHALRGTLEPYSAGIDLSRRNNVTIERMEVSGFIYGIFLNYSRNGRIFGNTLRDDGNGIYLQTSTNNNISGNSIENNYNGIDLQFSDNNSICKNNITANLGIGIVLWSSSHETLRSNIMVDNAYAFGVHGFSDFVNDVDVSNTIDGRPLYYWVGERDRQVPSDAGYVGLVDCSNITVQNLNLTDDEQAILLAHTTDSTITRNNITDNDYGIDLELSSSNNNIVENSLTDNRISVAVSSSGNNSVSGNKIDASNTVGISLDSSNNNTISGNSIAGNNAYGISLWISSSNNTIFQNTITHNRFGIGLGSSGNRFYHNNFVNNTLQVQSNNSANTWDDGYPSGGNYWSDYSGSDSNNDGIGDILYVAAPNNTDHYPLMNPWSPPNIAVTNVVSTKTVIGYGYTGTVNVTLKNQGSKIENVSIIVCGNSTVICSESTMLGMTNFTLSFKWNTTGFAYGNYTMSAYAEPMPEETDISDNNYTSNIPVHVGVAGDISGPTPGEPDGVVDIRDISYLTTHFNSSPNWGPNWNPNCDINDDGLVNIRDVTIAILHFHQYE